MRLWLAAPTALALANAYQVCMTVAAAIPGRCPQAVSGRLPYVALLIPAHDEEAGIGATLAAVRDIDYPPDRWRTIVIADNCSDGTAASAQLAGLEVYERQDPQLPGKGQALGWALARLLRECPEVEAVAVLDADCLPTANFLQAVAGRLAGGAAAVQVDYRVANPAESWPAGLRAAAFMLINTIRPRGKDRLGLSAGLMGTGMAFRRDLLERYPWDAASVVEDGEYHARLVLSGVRVAFAPEAAVLSPMPATLRQAGSQQARWESGKTMLARRWAPALMRAAVKRRDPAALNLAVELLLPPQSLLLALNSVVLLTAAVAGTRTARLLAGGALALQGSSVVGGLLLAGAPPAVYRSLAMAPVLAIWKVTLYLRLLTGRRPTTWVRTSRAPLQPCEEAMHAAR